MGQAWLVAVLVASGHGVVTQIEFATADRNGDFYGNLTPVQGMVPPGSKLSPGSLWQVVSPGLNCRRAADGKAAVVRQFARGDVLQVEVFRGGSDEVLVNAKDGQGKPWMPVRGKTLSDLCYVRANQRYIKPVVTGDRW